MFSRCLMVCTLTLAPALAGIGRSPANVRHFGRNILVAAGETVQNVSCFLCSAEVNGHVTGSVRVFAGHVFLNGSVGGNVVVFGGNLTLTSSSAAIGGHVFIFGGRLRHDSSTANYPHTVLPPIIFLPLILIVFAIIGSLIVLTRRMVRGPVAYPPLPRL
jgi:hypothetical protein